MALTVVLIILVFICILWNASKKPNKYPPGPPRWPLVGNIFLMRGRPLHLITRDLSQKFGEVTGFYLGSCPVILVSGLAAVKEAAAKDELNGRPVSKLQMEIGNGMIRGLIYSQGDLWQEQRRFTLRHLRDLGFGKRSLEGLIHEEINSLIVNVGRMAGADWAEPVELYDILGTSGLNVLWHVMAGRRYAHDDPKLKQLSKIIKDFLTIIDASGGVENNFPLLASYLPFLTKKKKSAILLQKVYQFLGEYIEKNKSTLDPENPRDFIDMYLIEIQKHKEQNIKSSFTERCLMEACRDLFMAGTDTTFNSITFALVYMVKYPIVQQRVQEELDAVVGKDRLPGLEDRPNLPYLDATIMESFRVSSVIPLAVPHAPLASSNSDVPFRGYIIPKNARILLNLSHIHKDPKIWGDPENFRPERFLDDRGSLLKNTALAPFGIGKRQCLGEALARNNMFLFFAGILQKFTMSIPKGGEPPSLDPIGGLTLAPNKFRAKITPRF